MNKRLIIVIGVTLILVVLGGVVLYSAFFSKEQTDVEENSGGLFPFLDEDQERTGLPSENLGNGSVVDVVENGDGTFDVGNEQNIPRLRALWSDPVAGGIIDAGVVRFIDRSTGHVYQTYATTTRTKRITNTTIPRIQEVVWPDLDSLVVRYLRENENIIETFAGAIVGGVSTTSKESDGEFRGQFLPINILDLAVRSDGTIFYLIEQNSVIQGFVSSFDGSGPTNVFSSVIRDWLPLWADTSLVYMTTKAGVGIPGHTLLLNTNSSALTPVLSNISGLSINSGTNDILYTSNTGEGLRVFSFNKDSQERSQLPITTLVEKCVWSELDSSVVFCAAPSNPTSKTLPDSWYRGATHFNDQLLKIDVETQETELLLNPKEFTNSPLDMVGLQMDEREEYIFFVNKTDGTPWLFRVADEEPVVVETPTTTQEI